MRQIREMEKTPFGRWHLNVYGASGVDYEDDYLEADAWNAALEWAAKETEDFARHYPVSIFTEPPSGKHGKTVDGCSAHAIRKVLPTVAQDILAGKEKP